MRTQIDKAIKLYRTEQNIAEFDKLLPVLKDIKDYQYLHKELIKSFNFDELNTLTLKLNDIQSGNQDAYDMFIANIMSKFMIEHQPPHFVKIDSQNNWSINAKELALYFEKHCKYFYLTTEGNDTTLLYVYNQQGKYVPMSKTEFKTEMREVVDNFGKPFGKIGVATYNVIDSAYKNFSIAPNSTYYKTVFDLNRVENIINFENGLLEFDKYGNTKFKAHDPSIISTIQLPVNYTTEIIPTPKFDKFIEQLVVDEDREQLLKFLALAISNYQGGRTKKAMFIIGQAHSGKSVLFNLVTNLIGLKNFFTYEIDKADDRFYTFRSLGKRLGGFADMKITSVKTVATFKAMTGNDIMEVEKKGSERADYKYLGVLMYGCNILPTLETADMSIYDRMLPIKCNPPLPRAERDTNLINDLLEEQQGIVLKLIPYLQDLIKNDFSIEPSVGSMKIIAEYKESNSSAIEFYNECCSMKKLDGYEQKKVAEVYSAYTTYCYINGYKPSSRKTWESQLKDYLHLSTLDYSKKDDERKSHRLCRFYITSIK